MKLTRLIGAGDKELVRATLLQLLFIEQENIIEHLIKAHKFCKGNGFRLRAYIPLGKAEKDFSLWNDINYRFLSTRRNDDTDVLTFRSKEEAQKILDVHIDVLIEGQLEEGQDLEDELEMLMESYPRQLIPKDHQQLSLGKLKALYPQFFIKI